MFKKIISVAVAGTLLAACAGDKSVKVTSLQRKDKSLSCKEIMLEINEAEFYRTTAEKNKNPKIKNLLMPLGYISTYVDADEAVGAANARVDYLNRIYDILDCDNRPARPRVAAEFPPDSDYIVRSGGGQPSGIKYVPVYEGTGTPYRAAPAPQDHRTEQYKDDWYW